MTWGATATTTSVVIGATPSVTLTDVRRITIRRGKTDEFGQYGPGTCTVEVDNPDGRLSPSNSGSPLWPTLRPGLSITIEATNATSGTRRLFTGYIEAFRDIPVRHGDVRSLRLQLDCFDEFGRLAAIDGTPGQTPVGAGDTSGERILRLLVNYGGVPLGSTSIATGLMVVQPTDLSRNLLDDIHLTAESEGGAVWTEPNGWVHFEDRMALVSNTRSNTSQATFGDAAGQLRYLAIEIEDASMAQVLNEVAIGRVGGQVQIASNATSISRYGTRRYSRTDLIHLSDTYSAGLANLILGLKREPEQKITAITFDAASSSALMQQALERRIRDRIRVVKQMAPGWSIDRACFVTRIEHEITQQSWVTTFGLVSAGNYSTSPPRVGSTFQVGVSALEV